MSTIFLLQAQSIFRSASYAVQGWAVAFWLAALISRLAWLRRDRSRRRSLDIAGWSIGLGLLVGLLNMIPVVGPWLAIPPAWCMERLFDLFLWISATCAAHLPYPEIAAWPWWFVALYYTILIYVLILTNKRNST